jgi:amino acid adenylation domain-containing protein/thioester reductase-like protein
MQRRNAVTDVFQLTVARHGDRDAVVDGDRAITYSDLDSAGTLVAQCLQDYGVGPGCVVPIVSHRSVEMVVAILGVLKTGAAYAVVDPDNPDRRRRKIIDQCGSPIALTTTAQPSVPGEVLAECAGVFTQSSCDGEGFRPVTADGGIAYVVFTSGTTGTPKGVIVGHHALTSLVSWHNSRFGMAPRSKSTLISGVGFDVLQWEVWSALSAGATLHIVDPVVRADPAALLAFYAERAITHAYVPTVLVPDVVATPPPDGLTLRYLFCAGEKLHPLGRLEVPYTLVDYYGPTEATIFATCRVFPPNSVHDTPSIGSPISDTEAFIVDENLHDVASGEVGELCLAGSCLARGYLGDPGLTRQRFVHSDRHNRRLCRTGDRARRLPDATIEFLGRLDDQIKIRGYRIELGDIEAAIRGNRLVKHAVVVVDDDERAGTSARVAAFVVPHDPATDPNGLIRALRAHMRDELPDYMQPAIYHCRPSLPVTANGKIDRVDLRAVLAKDRATPVIMTAFAEGFERDFAQVWREMLGHSHFTATDSFFDVGGHSLLATALIADISQRLGARVYIWDFYADPTIRGLGNALRARSTLELGCEGEPVRELADDIYLPTGVDFTTGYNQRQLLDPRHILLTGATGIIGVHLLERLLQTTDAVIHCPVRASSTALALERLRHVVTRYELRISDWHRVIAYPGDLVHPRFGLSDDDYAMLTEQIDVIYHSASAANFIQSYVFMRRDNVDGLRAVLRFAATDHVKPLLLVSSISIYSWGHLFTGKSTMYEDDDIDQNLRAVSTDLGYMRSKWVMEKIAQLAASQGLPVMTFRLGYATCNSRTGHAALYQWWPRLVKTCVALGAVPDLRNLREGLTTIDYIVDTIAAIGRQPSAVGKKFNVIPARDHIVTLKGFFRLLEEYLGYRFRVIAFTDWVQLWKDDSTAPLYPLLSMFHDRILDTRSTIELYQNTYFWDKQNVLDHSRGTGIEEPTFTKEILERYLGHVLAEPYIPATLTDAR